MKKASLKTIGIILIAIGVYFLIEIFSNFIFLRRFLILFGVSRASESAYKLITILNPLKVPIILIAIGSIFAGAYIAKGQ